MKNLLLNDHTKNVISVSPPGLFCVDAVTRTIYHVNKLGIQILKPGEEDAPTCDVLWSEHEIETNKIIAADVITATSAICVVTKEGDVITVNTQTLEVEVTGSVSAGLTAACWSPDQELLVLVTAEDVVVLMTAGFDPIAEFPLNQDSFGESKFINVGWGKKETQFHGREGKQAAKTVKGSVNPVCEWDDGKPRISWRGDGQLFVVSYVAQDYKNRRLRVVNREGILQYTSEDVDGLEQALSWKPSGSLIASTQRLPNKYDIVFFEKNGLKHGEFTLPFAPSKILVKEVMWNQDSSVLLVWLKMLDTTDTKDHMEDTLQLWTVGNYHWYLKQDLRIAAGVVDILWDSENPLMLHVLTNTHLHCYNWILTTSKSRGFRHADLAHVAVIDGRKLKMTPFKQSVIPPPMSAYEIIFTNNIQAVMFAPPHAKRIEASPDNSMCVEDSGFLETIDPPGGNSNNFCVLHGSDTVTFLTQAHANENLDDHNCNVVVTGGGGNGFTVKNKVHRIIAQHTIEWDLQEKTDMSGNSMMYNWVWAAHNILLACCKKEDNCYVAILEFHGIGSEGGRIVVKSLLPVEDQVLSVASSPDGTVALLQLKTGDLLKLNLLSQTIEPYEVSGEQVSFPSVCQQVSLCPLDNGSEIISLGLTSRNRLYWGSKQLFANCTSYHIHTDHLLLTTSNHMLHIIPLLRTSFQKLLDGSLDSSGVMGSRKIERGSCLVTAVPQDIRVLLQMPRGNLEMVSPRPLTVHVLKYSLSQHLYLTAYETMRKHRVDLNLLYDHDPNEFFKFTDFFVMCLDKPQWLDIFIASLSEVDVTCTMYSFNYGERESQKNKRNDGVSKINNVCKALRDNMITIDEERYLLPILTSYVKMNPSQMDVALRRVQRMKNAKGREFLVSADEGLRHLLYISDVNELFDVALGTYDFDLVLMVAEKSQKDPKEYLPFLNELRSLESNYMKYKINVHLRRFKEALKCIRSTNDHVEETLNLIVKENLHKEALQIFPPNSSIHKAACERYGDCLMSKECFLEAAIMYMRGDKLESALSAYKKAGNWRMMLVVASQLKFDKEMMSNLYSSIIEDLKEGCKFAEAAVIYESYMSNEEEAVECLVKASEWDDALRIAYKYNRPDLVDTNIKPGALEQHDLMLKELERISGNFMSSCGRLQEVRKIKEKQHLDALDGKGEVQLDNDLYSDTSTVTGFSYSRSQSMGSRTGSSATGRTYRSIKNKRKLERKKYSTKEGSPYEDLGLIAQLHELIAKVDDMAKSVTALATVLATFGMDHKAINLQSYFASFLNMINKHERDIWPVIPTGEEEEQEFGPHLTTEAAVSQVRGGGGEGNFVIQRMKELQPHLRHAPPPKRAINWSLNMFRQERSGK